MSDREEQDDEADAQVAMQQVIEVIQPGVDSEARYVVERTFGS